MSTVGRGRLPAACWPCGVWHSLRAWSVRPAAWAEVSPGCLPAPCWPCSAQCSLRAMSDQACCLGVVRCGWLPATCWRCRVWRADGAPTGQQGTPAEHEAGHACNAPAQRSSACRHASGCRCCGSHKQHEPLHGFGNAECRSQDPAHDPPNQQHSVTHFHGCSLAPSTKGTGAPGCLYGSIQTHPPDSSQGPHARHAG